MSVGPGNQETEIKLRAPSPGAAAELLTTHGFSVVKPRVFERNAMFDTPAGELRAAGKILRLRQAGDRATLTFKGEASTGRHKSREELETTVADPSMLALILERLGYRRTFIYEKYRTEFEDEDGCGVATLDETSIGTFLELEGPAEWIDATAAHLGFRESDYITASYGRLYLEWCAARDLTPANMTLDPEPVRA